ncbi:MAG: RluA family pseudouridine synthase [Bacteroidia bacterium]|nr:RluA family pseudouridine synthase [Bacteroidia bacterium]MCO5252849.1 RluA family pseudouridine synthase [Bacteroidota bacterium]
MTKAKRGLCIIYEDENYLVIDKPSGVASLDEHVFTTPSILRLLKSQFPDAQLCHRLDKETSGCLLASKHNAAYRHAAVLFEKRLVEKTYTAICNGSSNFENLCIDLPLQTSSKRVKVSHRYGKPAQTIVNTTEHFKHFSVVECKPLSGRTHQIRVHLAEQHTPIINDSLYGGTPPLLSKIKRHFQLSKGEESESPIIERIALHASGLSFDSIDGKRLEIKCPLSKDLDALLKILRRYDSA